MQTFVPFGINHRLTAESLDYRRLGKQRVEAWQILNTLTGKSSGWASHPAVKMWAGYENALAFYGEVICRQWRSLGYKDTMLFRFSEYLGGLGWHDILQPTWLFDESITLSHRSNLVRKFPEHYQSLWPDVPDDLPYVWPVQ